MTSRQDAKEPQPSSGELLADVSPLLKGSLAALRRAAQRARKVAQQTGTDLVVVRDGKVIRVSPEQESPISKRAINVIAALVAR